MQAFGADSMVPVKLGEGTGNSALGQQLLDPAAAEPFCRRVGRKPVGGLGWVGSQRAMNSRLRGCILSWAVKTQDGCRQGRCEQSSFRRPRWVRHTIPQSSLQFSDIAFSFFSGWLSTSNRHQTSSSTSWKMGMFI